VLTRQPAGVQSFLLETSVLERLTASLCDAVTGRDDGKATLLALERANLFLVPLDDRRQWFRYHHLFAEVLHAHLVDERPEQVPELHRRASTWFEGHDDMSQAVTHLLAGGDTARAADLMEQAMPVVQRERREAELARWSRALPDDVVRGRPVLGVAFVGALAQVGDFAPIGERLDQIEATARRADGSWPEQPPPDVIVIDRVSYRSLPARVEMYRAALSLASADLDGTVTHANQALSLAPPDDALTRAAAGALAGLASWTAGDLAAADAAYTESVAGLTLAGFLPDVLGCTITLGDIRWTQGQLAAALRTYRQALDATAPAPGDQPLRGSADMHVGIAGVLLERDDLDAAREQLAIAQRLGERNGLPQNPYRWRVATARLRAAEADLDEALALLDEADRVYNGDYAPNVEPVPAVRARLRLRRGELAAAEDWARDQGLAAEDDLAYRREYEHLTLARLLLARHRATPSTGALGEARRLLDRLLDAAEAGGRGARVIETLILQAVAHDAARDRRAAIATLRHAVLLAEPEGFVRVFADEGQPVADLLAVLQLQPDAPASVARLLAAAGPAGTVAPATQRLVEPLSQRELDVLRLLGGDLSGPDLARHLSVSLNTVRTHTKNIYAKLGATNRREAVRRARELDLIP
jgi:LuxR family maltose regulon positive regulatory protein